MYKSLLRRFPHPKCTSYILILSIFIFTDAHKVDKGAEDGVWFLKEPQDVIITPESGAVLDCIVGTSDPKAEPIIHWRMGDDQVVNFLGDSYRSQLPNGSLSISNYIRGNESVEHYTCIVEVISVGKIVSRTATVTTAKIPTIDVHPESLSVYPGQTAYFSCQSSSKPHPVVTWIKDQLPLILDETRMVILPSGSLEIDEVHTSDIGTYQCNVTGFAGSRLSEKAYLTVSQDIEGSTRDMSPEFIAEPNNTIALEGDIVTLECAANGNPRPDIKWFKDGETVDISYLDGRNIKIGTGGLQITNVKESDAGRYECRAENNADSVESHATISVHVIPRFLKQPTSRAISVKSDIELECEVYAKPEPTIHWLKNGDKVVNTSSYLQMVNGNNLRILGVMELDAGIFQCVASNSAGNIQAAAHLTVTNSVTKSKPSIPWSYLESNRSQTGPPKDLEAVTVKPRSVTLKWKPPLFSHGEISGYNIYYMEQSSDRERVVNTSRIRIIEEASISGLKPNTTYIFKVAAITSNGLGDESSGLQVVTNPELKVPSRPREVKAIPSTSELRVSWSPPIITNGNIERYRLYYYEYDSSEEHHIETEDTYYTLTGLKKYTEYFVWVVAYNHNGGGANSDQITVRTLSDVPSEPPTNVTLEATSSTAVTVRWDPPLPEGCNGIITGYKLRYRMRDRRTRPETVTTAGNKREHILTGLDKSSIYQVRIWAMNVNGTGPPTDWFTIETYEKDLDESTVPDAPSDVRAKPNGDSITVNWSPPKTSNVLVREYILSWGKGVPDFFMEKLDGKQRHFVIKDLEPNSEYVISLRARNDRGDGPLAYDNVRTKSENIIEPMTPLLPPVGLKATVVSSTSVILFWTDTTLPPDKDVTDGRVYVVRFNQYHPSSVNTKYRFHNSTVLNYMIDDLKPFTQYEFVVKVVNGRRESAWSMTVTNTTWESAPGSPPRDVTVINQENSPGTVSLSWQPPKIPNGLITSYVISYTTDLQSKERDWVTEHVQGDKMSTMIKSLSLGTTYYFHVKARNKKGFSISSPVVSITTPTSAFGAIAEVGNLNKGKGLSSTSLMYIIIVTSSVVVTFIAISVVFLCCRKSQPTTPDRTKKGYSKGKAGTSNIKPPDLWIHHDQMELKNLDKNQDGTSGGGGGGNNDTLTRRHGENTPPGGGTLEKRHDQTIRDYQTSYIGSQCQPLLMPEERISTLRRGPKPKLITLPIDNSHFREPVATAAPIGGTPSTSLSINPGEARPLYPRTQYARAHVTIDPSAAENPYVIQPAASVTYEPINQTNPPRDTQSNYGTGESGKRLQGHPLKSFSVPAPPPQSAPTTPQQKHIVTVRAQGSSPYKKSVYAGGATTSPVPKPKLSDDLPRIQASYSTEELNQEMANLEGLMKDLNAITASEFQC